MHDSQYCPWLLERPVPVILRLCYFSVIFSCLAGFLYYAWCIGLQLTHSCMYRTQQLFGLRCTFEMYSSSVLQEDAVRSLLLNLSSIYPHVDPPKLECVGGMVHMVVEAARCPAVTLPHPPPPTSEELCKARSTSRRPRNHTTASWLVMRSG